MWEPWVTKIGVVGYCPPSKFDELEATRMIDEAFDSINRQYYHCKKIVVSGWSNVGVLKIAYERAASRCWKTVGIAPKKVLQYDLYPVDESFVVGENFGDESEFFTDYIDILIRIGMGPQSMEEARRMREDLHKMTIEYDLPLIG